jgi:uncharacterized protein (DUF1778 family)
MTPSEKRAVQMAAAAAGQSASEFVMESALARAQETLLDRQRFGLDAGRWARFQAALDGPAHGAPRLARLLNSRSVFE